MRAYNNQREYDSAEAEEILSEMQESRLRDEREGLRSMIDDWKDMIREAKFRIDEISEILEEGRDRS